MKEDDLEYHLADPEDNDVEKQKKALFKKKVIIITTSIILLLIIISIIITVVIKNKDDDDDEDEASNDKTDDGDDDSDFKEYKIYKDISYAVDKKIINTFKIDGENYNETIGNIYNGNDYDESEKNFFDLCIPYNSTKRKNKYNKIILMIHGGGWIQGERFEIEGVCKAYLSLGFISASMSYSLLNNTEYESNIFRILDEVSSVLKGIKLKLKQEGFDENKLELLISGGSAGSHISMLYSYLIKNTPIPIKAIYNLVGPVSLDPEHYLINKNENQTLENIDPESIENAIKEDLIEPLADKNLVNGMSNLYLIHFMNCFLGRKFDDNLDEIYNKETNKIKKESEKYQELLNTVKYAFPITHVTNNSIPTICAYGGQDIVIGIGQYAQLKTAFDKNNNKNIDLAYFRYGSHDLDFITEDGQNARKKMTNYLIDYSIKYFQSD